MKRILRNNNDYEILGVGMNATDREIKQAFRRLALKYHPDKNSDPLALEVFKKIADSYTTLIDDNKRAELNRNKPSPTPASTTQNQS